MSGMRAVDRFLRDAEEVWSAGYTGHAVENCSCLMLRDCVFRLLVVIGC